ncbi:anti-sigma factor antagonist [Streptomyces sp. NPDC002795]|uniref:anti-sigma factor antagonist n=1 Tax=Streptomyces sp. NPDC002795 TaxID=3364665 RepID=UPI0036965B07
MIAQAPRTSVTSFRLPGTAFGPGRARDPGGQMLQSGQQDCAFGAFGAFGSFGSFGAIDITSAPEDGTTAPRLRTVGDCVVVELAGEIDILTFHRISPLLNSVAAGPYRVVVVDLTGATFFDCSGLRLLERAAHRAGEHDGRVTVVCRHRLTLRLIALGGLTGLLAPAWTVSEAVRKGRQLPD